MQDGTTGQDTAGEEARRWLGGVVVERQRCSAGWRPGCLLAELHPGARLSWRRVP